MGSLVPGAWGEGRLATGYGALDESWSAMEGEGVFTETRGLEPYMLARLDRKYKIYGAHEEQLNPGNYSDVPLGRQAIIGEDLGQAATVAISQDVQTTQHQQPEAIGKHVGRQPTSDIWSAEDNESPVDVMKNNPVFMAAVIGGAALVGYWAYKNYLKR